MLFDDLVATSLEIAATRSRTTKIAAIAACLRTADPAEVEIAASYLAGSVRQPRLDVGWRTVRGIDVAPAPTPTLTPTEVHEKLDRIADAKGPGSRKIKNDALVELLSAATDREQQYLHGLILGELRQGALEGMIAQAVAAAWDVPASAVQRAWMLTGDLGVTAATAAREGEPGLAAFSLTLFRPVHPMLAQSAESAGDAMEKFSRVAVDYKLDGARIQVHREGDTVTVYTRSLREVTPRLPEVVALSRSLPVSSAVLDGEVIGVQSDGRPHPFQETMARFGSDVGDDTPAGVAMVPVFFDCIYRDGEDLLDAPFEVRREALHRIVPPEHRVRSEVVTDATQAQALFEEALQAGHEGVVIKDLASTYAAGRRGGAWVKVKPSDTLDLVVLGVEWGSGRHKG